MRVKLHRYKVKRKGITRSSCQAKKEYATISQLIHRLQVGITDMKRELDDRCVHSTELVRDECSTSSSKLSLLDSTINVRTILAVLYLGVGGSNILKLLSMMSLNGGLSFERNISRHTPAIMKLIREECALIIDGAFKNEIIATLR